MKKKRIAAALTAVLCSSAMLSAMPFRAAHATAYVTNDFEVNYDGWFGNADSVELTAQAAAGFGGSRGMVVSGRSTAQEGASSSKDFYLIGGVKYKYSVKVFSETAETFRLTLLCKDPETGAETTKELACKRNRAGEWTTLSATYTAPKNSTEFLLTITTDSTNDFVFDQVVVTSDAAPVTASAASLGLKDEFANYGFRVGNILNWSTVGNDGIKANLLKDCNAIECENETKPSGTLVKDGSTDSNMKVSLSGCAKICDFCVQNNLAFRGHTMVWHSQTPTWFFKEGFNENANWVSASVMDQRMESYIKNMFAAFQTQYPSLNLYAYDVCNECISDNAEACNSGDGHRSPGTEQQKDSAGVSCSPWVAVYGDNRFIEKAFTYARQYAPSDCKLFYNDYNEYASYKRDCIIRTVTPLKEKGVLDGVGMQSHVDAGATGWSGTDVYIEAMQKYLNAGLDVQITELDISVKNHSESEQVEKYKAIFNAAKEWNASHPRPAARVTLVQVWGPNDANSWLSSGSNGTLYDTNNQPKSAYTALTQMINASEWGDGSAFTEDGQAAAPELDKDGYWFHYTFENGDEGFSGRSGAETLVSSADAAYAGSRSLSVSGREAAWNGASHALNSSIFKGGESYSFSANVKYDNGTATDTFHLTMQYQDSAGETNYVKIDTQTAVKGEWVQLSNPSFTIPAGASNLYIYVETDKSTTSFYLDDVIGAPEGTVISGAGAGETFLLGDVDCDGVITAKDLTAAKRGLRNGFASSVAGLAADVDQSGSVDADDIHLLDDYLLHRITEFPKAEIQIDFTAMAQKFAGLNLTESLKLDGENNPLTTQRFGADPGWMVYKDRLYVYTTNDAFEYDSNGNIKENSYAVQTINCVSSADLVNWTDHGAIPAAGANGAAKWAYASWAPDACWKTINGKDKFFLYFANSAGGIGVLTADSPTGPWTDPLGHALITKQTANCGDVEWMFDPGVFVDDDGTGYIYFGGGIPSGKAADPGTARCCKLGDDMISLSGDPVRMNPPYLFEDSSIIRIGNTYYYSYCTNFQVPGGTSVNGQSFGGGEICYMTASNPLGPWTFGGRLFKNPASYGLDKGGNNHHSLVYFKDQYYLLYHARAVENRMGYSLNYRSTHIDKANVVNGTVSVDGTMTGVSQIGTLNPYETVQAETMAQQAGINISGVGDTVVTDISAGDWIKLKGVDFSQGCKYLTVRVASQSGAAIKVCTKSPSGEALTYVDIPAGTSMTEITVPMNSVTGVQDLCFVFSGALEFDSWSVSAT